MFETVTTNAAGILTIIVLWSTLVWLSTYMYMSEKIRRKNETIKFLDRYIDLCEDDIRQETEKNQAIEREFGHIIDDYIEHYYSDGAWELLKLETDRRKKVQ